MAHPDLYDETTRELISGFGQGVIFATIDVKRGMVWHHVDHGGIEDALPREQLLIAHVVNALVEETGLAHWEYRDDKPGVVFHDKAEYIPLADLGVSKAIGFYRLSLFPDVVNDAADY